MNKYPWWQVLRERMSTELPWSFHVHSPPTHQCTYPPGSSQNLLRARFSHGISLLRYDWLKAISSSFPLSEVQGVGLKILILLLFHLWFVPGGGIHSGSLGIIKDTPTTQKISRILGALCPEKRPSTFYIISCLSHILEISPKHTVGFWFPLSIPTRLA